ncbi:MAG: hypothetical protein LC799_04850 [Actinobacteria bacterium]|nr:hypothetical protein [Actinomycetota bacterium]
MKATLDMVDGFMAYPMVREKVPFAQALPRAAWLMSGPDNSRLEVLGDWEDEYLLTADF